MRVEHVSFASRQKMEALLSCKRHCILVAFQLWKRQQPHQSREQSIEDVIRTLSLRIPPRSRTEVHSEELVCELFCDAMDFAHRKGFTDGDAVHFLSLFVKTLDLCRKVPGEETEVSSTQHLALDAFQEKLLSEWSSTISHPFSSLALEYVLSTVFTHLHLYQLVLNDAGTVETLHVDLTVPPPPVCEPLQQGVPQTEWELAEKMKELEAEHQKRLHQLDTMKQPLKWERTAPIEGLAKEETSTSLSSAINAFTTKQVDNLAMDLSHQVNLYQEHVDYKTRVTETRVQHKKNKTT